MASIVVCGSLNMDLSVTTPKLPRPGETCLGGGFEISPGGKGGNQAVAAARLGAGGVTLIGSVGGDEFGRALRRALEDEGIHLRVKESTTPTGVAIITIDDRGENSIVVAPGANAELTARDLEAERGQVEGADWLIVQLELPVETVARAVEIAADSRTRVLLNAAPARGDLSPELLSRVDVLVVNEIEAAMLLGIDRDPTSSTDANAGDDAALLELLEALQRRLSGSVVITRGRRGAVAGHGGDRFEVDAFAVDSIDTVGSGDAFVGALAVALCELRPFADALRFATAAGALATTARGAQEALPHRRQVERLLAD